MQKLRWQLVMLLVFACSGKETPSYKNDREALVNTHEAFIDGTKTFNSLEKVLEKVEPVMGGAPTTFAGRTLVIFFNSECDHCQQEASNLSGNLDQLANAQIWWMSFEEPDVMRSFLEEKGVTNHPNTYAFYIDPEAARDLFGFMGMPQSMIYDEQGLLNAFLGPITFEEQLKAFFE